MPPLVSVNVQVTDDRRGQDDLVKRLTQNASHVDIGIHSVSGEELVTIATANEFGAHIQHPGGQPFIIVDDNTTAAQRKSMFRGQRSARVPLEGGKVLIFLKKGKRGMGVTKPHEINIPARSFIRSTVDENRAKYERLVEKSWNAILDGNTDAKQALVTIGFVVETDVRNKVRNLQDPANAASTVRAKGSENPLVDTGTLLNSIRYVVKSPQEQPVVVSNT